MAVWSTQIPIIPTRTTHELLALCKTWLIGSPHSNWIDADFGDLGELESKVFNKGSENVSILRFQAAHDQWCAFRYVRNDAERRTWTTDVCGWKSNNRFLVGVQLDCQTLDLGPSLPEPKKPYVVRQILEVLGGDLDGSLPVSSAPIFLSEGDIDMAIRLLRGESENFLPAIYASATWEDRPSINPQTLARWAAGMAHVVIEPSRQFSFVLADKMLRQNPYDGAVSICWPKGAGRQTRLFPYYFATEQRFASAIAALVRDALADRRSDPRCTFEFVRERAFSARTEALRREGAEGLDAFASAFDDELAAKSDRLEQAEKEIARLKGQLARGNMIQRVQGEDLLARSKEQDLYAGELRDAVLHALNIAKNQVHPSGRLKTLLESVIAANPPVRENQRIEDAIREGVGTSNALGTRERRALENLGFTISDDGKHYKLVFRNDDRYTFAMPETGSDYRGMKNWVSDVANKLFK